MWGKALNGDYYKGVVTGLGEMLHIKFDNGDTIAHDRTDPECVVFDQTPEVNDLEIGKGASLYFLLYFNGLQCNKGKMKCIKETLNRNYFPKYGDTWVNQ